MTYPVAISANQIHVSFGSLQAVDGVSLQINGGELFGLVGHNGAGKSTLMRALAGIIEPDSGDVTVSARGAVPIGASIDEPAFYEWASAERNLSLFARLGRLQSDSVEVALERVGLNRHRHKRARSLSHGMRQRLAVARAILGDPDILLLDEPTNGLDPEWILNVREILTDYAAEGHAVLVSSHDLHGIEEIATMVGVMRDGSMVASGPRAEIVGDDGLERLFRTP